MLENADIPVIESRAIDTSTCGTRNTFDCFKEAIEGFPVHCTLEYSGKDPFYSRWNAIQRPNATAIGWKSAVHSTKRTENDIADSIRTGYAILYAIAGGAEVAQGGQSMRVGPGEMAIYNLDQPAQIDNYDAPQSQFVLVTVPHDVLQRASISEKLQAPLRPISFHRPLYKCVDYLGTVLAEKRADRAAHALEACQRLLVAELLCSDAADRTDARRWAVADDRFDRVLRLIGSELVNPDLSPQWLAQRFGVSVRYIHKLFGSRGLTCQGYIVNARLAQAKQDLIGSAHPIRISAVAYRWGFSDASSFARAFKTRFGCTPGECRKK